jgi:hypothetical protein
MILATYIFLMTYSGQILFLVSFQNLAKFTTITRNESIILKDIRESMKNMNVLMTDYFVSCRIK